MPRTPKSENRTAEILAPVPRNVLDQFVRDGPLTAEAVAAAPRRFKQAIIERARGAELSDHLGYPPGGDKPDQTAHHRNGTAVLPDGTRDILGVWIEQTEGAKFWLKVH
jgi:transposase-like protein